MSYHTDYPVDALAHGQTRSVAIDINKKEFSYKGTFQVSLRYQEDGPLVDPTSKKQNRSGIS
jgi:hypothetical protein